MPTNMKETLKALTGFINNVLKELTEKKELKPVPVRAK